MRILVVEDEPDLSEAIAVGLRREGYAVDLAADGADAMDKLAVASYDLVCLDLNLARHGRPGGVPPNPRRRDIRWVRAKGVDADCSRFA